MRGRQFQTFATRHLLPHLPGFVADGNLIYRTPVGDILQGFLFDSSAFSAESFRPQVFVQPLYLPSKHRVLNLGQRFPGIWKFQDADEPLGKRLLHAMHRTGLPFLSALGSPAQLVEHVRAAHRPLRGHYLQQVLAYSLVLMGENDDALDELDSLAQLLNRMSETQPWAKEIHAEVGLLKQALMRAPQEARQLLRNWIEETRRALHLPE